MKGVDVTHLVGIGWTLGEIVYIMEHTRLTGKYPHGYVSARLGDKMRLGVFERIEDKARYDKLQEQSMGRSGNAVRKVPRISRIPASA